MNIAARELAEDLVDEWHELDVDVPLYAYMRLTEAEYGVYVSSHALPRDFEARHGW